MIKTHLFRGKRYKIFFRSPNNKNHLGTCNDEDREIEIRPTLKGEEELDCIVHESLHACFPDIHDYAINEAASSIAEFLTKLGYERVKMRSKFVSKPQKNSGGMKGTPQNAGTEKNFTRISHNSKHIKKK